ARIEAEERTRREKESGKGEILTQPGATMPNTSMNPQITVLYVAQDSAARAVLTDALRKGGLSVREAATASEALAGMDQKPDLALLNLELPDLSGFEVCRRIKAEPGVAAIPVLLMSATFAKEADRLQALAAGADGYLITPVDPAELLQHIKALVSA